MKTLFIGVIRIYQNTWSKMTPPSCRFYPSCSEYTIQAIDRYGLGKGIVVGVKRILKCHPFHPGGIDLVGEHHDHHHRSC